MPSTILLTLIQKNKIVNAVNFFERGDVDSEQLVEKIIEIVES